MSYTIKSGDTFWSIAEALHISVEQIQQANPGVDSSSLNVGQVIKLPDQQQQPGDEPAGSTAYVAYGGPASNFPDPVNWASWETLWASNSTLMRQGGHDSDSEIGMLSDAINTVAQESGIDRRVILCVVMQETGGNVHSGSTSNGVNNPGLMQSHNGVSFSDSDPAGSILQMIRDGTEGTRDGDGLTQLYARYHNYYSAFRGYNSGSVNESDLNDPVGATGDYVQKIANRLMGHKWDQM